MSLSAHGDDHFHSILIKNLSVMLHFHFLFFASSTWFIFFYKPFRAIVFSLHRSIVIPVWKGRTQQERKNKHEGATRTRGSKNTKHWWVLNTNPCTQAAVRAHTNTHKGVYKHIWLGSTPAPAYIHTSPHTEPSVRVESNRLHFTPLT